MVDDGQLWSIAEELKDVPFVVQFYSTWSGYSHPVKLQKRISYDEALGKQAYYRAYFRRGDGVSEDISMLEKFFVAHELMDIPDDLTHGQGEAYYSVSVNGGKVKLENEIALKDTLELERFAKISFGDEHKPVSAELLSVEFAYSYEYTYSKGKLVKAVIKNPEGTVVLE